jgi:hypothetical protein
MTKFQRVSSEKCILIHVHGTVNLTPQPSLSEL